ncbi:Uncharacterized protein dnm_014100 [Desulfonema magnum]|uniref:Uncharacterized protein n=1 Tax=Desulfonema magnum TaxID=45655 RepID=A0A975BHD6_9BACT|nr:Uncharacterized protein dnm_014100 [Desulfonema magnum]
MSEAKFWQNQKAQFMTVVLGIFSKNDNILYLLNQGLYNIKRKKYLVNI